MNELLFFGAAGEVTGSMHMLHVGNQWLALDCGMFQGHRGDAEQKNREWPVAPSEISAVVVSHAHIDHTGRLPKLVKDGFSGPILATPATRDLSAIMLPDSAHIQEEDVVYVNKKRARKGLEPIGPLYDYEDALAAIRQFETVSQERWFDVLPGVHVRYHDAGHMLGSGSVELRIGDGPQARTICFTGDIGRPNTPILRDPTPLPQCDVLISESTYGGRVNDTIGNAREQLIDIVKRTYGRGGKLIIPAFAVGRTQTLVYYMHEAMTAKQIPTLPIYVDSPLAVDATSIFKLHPECYDAQARAFHSVTGDILGQHYVTYIRDVSQSKALNERKEPCAIISASGMCEAGRIRHHIKNNIADPKNTILLVGYQAADTLGRRLAEGIKTINLFHETYPVNAEVVQIHGFSGHADQADLLRMLRPLAAHARQSFLVHGELDQSAALKPLMEQAGFAHVAQARRGMRVRID